MLGTLPNLRKIREAKGLTRPQLCDMADVNEHTIKRAEGALKGKFAGGITLYNACQIADALGVSLDLLAGRTEPVNVFQQHQNLTHSIMSYEARDCRGC